MTALNPILDHLNKIIVGKRHLVEQALCCILAGGHLLLEDIPGRGKTVLAQALAKVLGLQATRIQFTSDMLPADIIGVSVFNSANGSFQFHQGPIFGQFILADEVNRATPKTQSALLEAMDERAVTIDGKRMALPLPFVVVATQNPNNHIGTYPLPEAQLDRFLMRLPIGELDPAAECELLRGESRQMMLQNCPSMLQADALANILHQVQQVEFAERLISYLQRLLADSRDSGFFAHGLSPRAGLGIKAAAKAQAFIRGRAFVAPEDLQSVLFGCANHRLQTAEQNPVDAHYLQQNWIARVDIDAAS